ACLIGAVGGAGSTAAQLVTAHARPLADLARAQTRATLSLTVSGDPHPVGRPGVGPPTYGFDARLTRVATAGTTTQLSARVFVLSSNGAWAGLLPGQRTTVDGRLGVSSGADLDAAVVSVTAPPTLVGRPPWTQRAAGSLRSGLQRACADLPTRVRGLLPGLIDGDTTHLDPAVATAFRTTGMTHLLAVSGSNVAMVIGFVLLLCRWSRAGPTMSAIVCGIALVGFVILVRPTPSVLRAAVMGSIGLVALATGRVRAAVPALATAVTVLIVYDPALATDIGFGLSTFATAGLLLIAPHWRDALLRRRVPRGAAEALAVPAAAQVACSPLIAGFTGTVSIIAVPANLVAIPAVPAATILGVAAAVISPMWPSGAAFLAWLASWPARWLLVVAERGAAAPDAVTAWPSGVWGALALAVILGAGLVAVRRRPVRIVAAVALVAGAIGAVPVRIVAGGWPPRDAVFVMCDVGQGDGSVLPLGGDAAIVIDTGPEPVAIDGCLRRLRIDYVPLLVLTHFHEDHVGGLAGVLDGRRIGALLVSPFDDPTTGYRDVIRTARADRIPIRVPTIGEVLSYGPVRLTVLGPVAQVTGTRSDPNNNSLVIRADELGERVLLTGDAEIEEQTEVLATVGAAALKVDILKMPHHGSAYQDWPFLAAADPAAVFVSVGADNEYGLPSVAALDRLAAGGARVLRTDSDGDLAAVRTTDGLGVSARGRQPGQRPQ
ncbi:MAG TPA: ComEC/Rec2 family competence protein, partial [Micromonosporaceae bacterium]|nr:ComEC/Rec2 family competence protein [Micromonosporaceae bacterium]